MRKRRVVLCVLALLTSASFAHASTLDSRAPTTSFQTREGAILANGYPAYEDLVGGYANDDLSGIARVQVAFVAFGTRQAFNYVANIGCFDDTMRSCMWRVMPPLVPGQYTVTAFATDQAGNAQKISPRVTVVVI